MAHGVVINPKDSLVICHIANEDEIPEQAIVPSNFNVTFALVQGDQTINLNYRTLPLLAIELQAWVEIMRGR